MFQEALKNTLGSLPEIKCCSRTDAGVHANNFYINFYYFDEIDEKKFIRTINYFLPEDIRVKCIVLVNNSFHARYSAVSKRYIYKIWNDRVMNPFLNGLALHFPTFIDEKFLEETAKVFIGTMDFRALISKSNRYENTVRTIKLIEIIRDKNLVTISIEADGFLYNMARSIVGTLINVQRGKLDTKEVYDIIQSQKRSNLSVTAPACGLYLDEVSFDFGENNDNKG